MWKPALFGAKPELVLKGGMIACANMGDPNASIPTPQPTFYRPQFAAHGRAKFETCVTFVSQAAHDAGLANQVRLAKRVEPVSNTRNIGKADMVLNDSLPKSEVDPETYTVKADGEVLTCEPATELPLAQRYFLFSHATDPASHRTKHSRVARGRAGCRPVQVAEASLAR